MENCVVRDIARPLDNGKKVAGRGDEGGRGAICHGLVRTIVLRNGPKVQRSLWICPSNSYLTGPCKVAGLFALDLSELWSEKWSMESSVCSGLGGLTKAAVGKLIMTKLPHGGVGSFVCGLTHPVFGYGMRNDTKMITLLVIALSDHFSVCLSVCLTLSLVLLCTERLS